MKSFFAKSLSNMFFGLKLKSLVVIVTMALLQSCGDIVNIPKHIVRNYYLSDSEEQNNFFVCYKLSDGSLVGRTPEHVSEYGYLDSLLIVNVENERLISDYYIINMNKDYDVAKEENFRVGPVNATEIRRRISTFESIKWTKAH